MKRKIIKQSGRAYTITLPINWIRENNIEEGDEIELNENNNQLNIVTENTNTPKTSISLDIPKGKESSIRTLLINTYRSGFDV
ncbi:MAG: AbrB/MazE/SpoVT family DNA-binding domain-containing protein, partial [Nanoarchaeota archaeon]|nr:AbrB/MazE/SpoVT family DNA-binding domain-containing protein [Nanoarchaeota archaeon]